jgi:hypothetical protein
MLDKSRWASSNGSSPAQRLVKGGASRAISYHLIKGMKRFTAMLAVATACANNFAIAGTTDSPPSLPDPGICD